MGTGGSGWAGTLVGLGLLASACGSTGETPTVAESSPAAAPTTATTSASAAGTASSSTAPDTSLPADDAPLDFAARRLSGGTFDGTDLQGTDVVLWMWAPWCPQCNREAPHVADAVERFGDRVTFVGVPGRDSDAAHQGFVDEHDLDDLTHVVDEDGSLWARFGINYQPAWVFVDEDGTSRVVAGGLYEDLGAHVQELVDG